MKQIAHNHCYYFADVDYNYFFFLLVLFYLSDFLVFNDHHKCSFKKIK